MSNIFLSHSHQDRPFARRLAEQLQSHGIGVWLDEAEMRVGDSLIARLESAIRESSYLGVILSPRSVSSPWVQREVHVALNEEIRGSRVKVLPILQEPCEIPGFLAEKVYADFTTDFDEGLRVLLARLQDDFRGATHRQRKASELLRSSYQSWLAFEKGDEHLLDRQALALVLDHSPQTSLASDLAEYLLLSAAMDPRLELAPRQLERLREWTETDFPQLFDRILAHGSPQVPAGLWRLATNLGDKRIAASLLRAVVSVREPEVRREAVAAARRLGIAPTRPVAQEIFAASADWVVRAYALRSLPERANCLVVSDGTGFAGDLGKLAESAGFRVVTLPAPVPARIAPRDLDSLWTDVFSLVVVVRGEHYSRFGHDDLFDQVKRFLAAGGTVLATPWLSWEVKFRSQLAEFLPFEHIADSYNEDVEVSCEPTGESFSRELLAASASYRASIELLRRKPGSTVLLEDRSKSLPILGFRHFEQGTCYYLNTCQHLCFGEMTSPLAASPDLNRAVGALLAKIHSLAGKRPRGGAH